MKRATLRGGRWFSVRIVYDREMVEALKRLTPRAYDPTLKTWSFPVELLGAVARLLAEHGYDFDTSGVGAEPKPSPPPPPPPPPNGGPYAVLGLDPRAPLSVVQAAWRALAKELHPDAGGTKEQFQKLEAAYSQILKERNH